MSEMKRSARRHIIAGIAVLALAVGAYGFSRLYTVKGPSAGTINPDGTQSAYYLANRAKPVPPGWTGTVYDAQEEFSMTPAEAEVLVSTGVDTREEVDQDLAIGEEPPSQ